MYNTDDFVWYVVWSIQIRSNDGKIHAFSKFPFVIVTTPCKS
jgi:hypothetical protein